MFKKGDSVIVKHDRKLGICVVTKAKEKTDMTVVSLDDNGNVVHAPVEYYVRIDTPDGKAGLGYHEENLEKHEG